MSEADLGRWLAASPLAAFDALFGEASGVSGLSRRDQALVLVGLHAVHGGETEALQHGRTALATGASPAGLVEVVLAAALSRGGRALRHSRLLLAELPPGAPPRDEPPQDARAYLAVEFGDVPEWARNLDAFAPVALGAYTTLRQRILVDGATPRRVKELVTMVLNAIDGNAGGTRSHAAAALRHGADRAAILGALLLGVRVGGIVTWINGVAVVADLVGFPTHD